MSKMQIEHIIHSSAAWNSQANKRRVLRPSQPEGKYTTTEELALPTTPVWPQYMYCCIVGYTGTYARTHNAQYVLDRVYRVRPTLSTCAPVFSRQVFSSVGCAEHASRRSVPRR